MKFDYKNSKLFWFAISIVYFMIGYLPLNWLSSTRLYYIDVAFPFEAHIPFIPLFIFGYLLVYLGLLGLYFLITDIQLFKKMVKFFFALTTVHYFIFIIFPVKMALRPVISETDILNGFVKFYYWIDMPYNCFPSLHVAYTLMGAFVLWNYKRAWAWAYIAATLIVSISVILVKQHYMMDVAGGYITTSLLYIVIFRKRFRAG